VAPWRRGDRRIARQRPGQLVDAVAADFVRLDILVNNAAMPAAL
jgi:NAD(P)-dependent dehydrogenase (short-subunit alcohol dehydrogenase family)